MKYFLDSAKIDEIREAYSTFGIDGVTTNPNHIMNSGKPFYTVIKELADFVRENGLEGYEKFPVSVEINPHFDEVDEMIAMARLKKRASAQISHSFSPRRRRLSPPRTARSSFHRSSAGKSRAVRTARLT